MNKLMLWMRVVVPAMIVMLSLNASATLINQISDAPFLPDGAGSYSVTVTSQVTQDQPGGTYHYTYQIMSTDVQLTWFAIALLENNVTNYDPGTGSNVPDLWNYVDPLSAEAVFFSDPIAAGEASAVMSFDSLYAPTETAARVTGLASGSLYGTVLAPIPEPATLALLGFGAIGCAFKKRKRS